MGKMKSMVGIIIRFSVCILSVQSISIPRAGLGEVSKYSSYPTSDYPYPTSHKTYPTSDYPYPTSHKPYPTSDYPYSTTHKPYPTSPYPYSTTHKPYPTSHHSNPTSHKPYPTSDYPHPTTPKPDNVTCYGHYIYKEEHNVIVDGEDDRHKSVYECEFACTVITECRFWKFTMNGEHRGYCELNRGTPLEHGEVVGQRNVKLIDGIPGKEPYCEFQ